MEAAQASFRQAILDEIARDLGLGGVLLSREEEPGEGGDRVSLFPGGVENPGAEIGDFGTRQIPRGELGARQGGRARFGTRGDEEAVFILEQGAGRVGQLRKPYST